MAMATPVKMPELGESITEGTITRWLKQEGDRVEVDEPLFEVSTDKVDTEVPSPVAGVLQSIKVQVDETVEVGAELAVIEQDGEGGGAAQPAPAEAQAEAAETPEAEAPESEAPAGEAAEAEAEPAREEPPAAAASGDGETATVAMPELGESITEGTITRWLKQEGDRVEVDEPLFEVSTDKVDTEVPSPVAGVLQSIKVQVDETVEVGAELAVIEQDGEGGGAAQPAPAEAQAEAAETPEAEAPESEAPAGEAAEAEAEPAREEPPAAAASGDGETATVAMPELGESITEGTITRWLKQEGDRVEVD